MSDDRTRIIGQTGMPLPGGTGQTQMGANRTQMMGTPPTGRTQMGGPGTPGFDPMRTQMNMPSMQTVELECLAGNRYAYAPEVTRDNALVVLKVSGQQLGRRAPINVCLCIDRSGSMEGPPLEYVKRACDYVVDMLEPNDILSIVTFEEQVDVLMPARRVVNKALVKEHIHRLEVGNTTNLYDGLMAGCMQIASVQAQTPGYVSRVLLLTERRTNGRPERLHVHCAAGGGTKAKGHFHHRARLRAGIQRRTDGRYRAAAAAATTITFSVPICCRKCSGANWKP